MSNKINLSLFHSRKFGFWKVNQLLKVIFKLIIFYIFACDFTMEYVVGWFCVDGGDELGCRLRVLVSREWNTIYLNCKGNSNWFRLFFFRRLLNWTTCFIRMLEFSFCLFCIEFICGMVCFRRRGSLYEFILMFCFFFVVAMLRLGGHSKNIGCVRISFWPAPWRRPFLVSFFFLNFFFCFIFFFHIFSV